MKTCPRCNHHFDPVPQRRPDRRNLNRVERILRWVFITTGVVILVIVFATSCASSITQRYPWHGPILDPDGNPPPEPTYEAIQE